MSATFTKLKDGSWGLRVVGTAQSGVAVVVKKKDGSTDKKTIGKVIWTGNGISLCTIAGGNSSSFRKPARCTCDSNPSGWCPKCDGRR